MANKPGICLRQENGPRLALLDWMMPGMEGAEVCRQVRAGIRDRYVYMMLLSVRADLEDVVKGMESGRRRLHCQAFPSG